MNRLFSVCLLTIGSMTLHACGDAQSDGSADENPIPAATIAGEVLVSQQACFACHEGPGELADRLAPMPAPRLEDVGRRLSPSYMRRFLASPHQTKVGTIMPDILGTVPSSQRNDVIEDIVHYLQSRGGPFVSRPHQALKDDLLQGRGIFETVGCAVCHTTPENARLATMTDPDHLAEFLLDPLKTRPSGRMPNMRLDSIQAKLLSLWLLRDRVSGEQNRRPGLVREYVEGRFDGKDPSLGDTPATETKVVTDFSIKDRRKNDFFGFRFRGSLEIPEDGDYTFYTSSDDGSWLTIDGRMIVDNGGIHGTREKSGRLTLKAGRHAIFVSMFEFQGGEVLKVQWAGPGIDKGPIPAAILSHETLEFAPIEGGIKPDPARVREGEALFRKLRCASCHEPENNLSPRASDLSKADLFSGCLSGQQTADHPTLALDAAGRWQARAVLAAMKNLPPKRSAPEQVEFVMTRLDCARCHERDGRGGPDETSQVLFQGMADLGEEGRIPPRLTGIGHKLRTPWLQKVLDEGASVRPYMLTHMPVFGPKNVAGLAELLAEVDQKPGDEEVYTGDLRNHEVGRRLVGKKGFNCINCHAFAGKGASTQETIDLSGVHDRIRTSWMREFFENPAIKTPGTRMPMYWSKGKVEFPKLAGGDARRQMDAILGYLSLGKTAKLPIGAAQDNSEYELEPEDQPMMFGSFMKGVGPRTYAVGFPEGLHYAFDARGIRLARLWRGAFINAAGMWRNRGTQLQEPSSMDLVELAPGAPFAVLKSLEEEWPKPNTKDRTWRMRGTQRLKDRTPSFFYAMGDMVVQETIRPSGNPEDPVFQRTFKATSIHSVPDLWHRAARGRITRDPANSNRYMLDGKLNISSNGPPAVIRENGGLQELLFPMKFVDDNPSVATLEITLSW